MKPETRYHMVSIGHPNYSHCITIDYNEVIAYKHKKTGIWRTTDYLIENNPKDMKVEYRMDSDDRELPIEELLTLIDKNELFLIEL